MMRRLLALLLAAPLLAQAAAAPPRAAVLLDPGHGGNDPGVQLGGFKEADYALALAQDVAERLKGLGIVSQLTRDSDQSLSLSARVALAGQLKPDLLLSLHVNASYATGASGPRIFVPAEGPVDDAVAPLWEQASRLHAKDSKALGLALARGLGVNGPRPVQSLKMGLFRGLAVPACVLECGFATDPASLAAFKDPAKRGELASHIAGALAHYLREGAHAP
jgi:N-acetylmuramoyl-L-alanine amidase